MSTSPLSMATPCFRYKHILIAILIFLAVLIFMALWVTGIGLSLRFDPTQFASPFQPILLPVGQ